MSQQFLIIFPNFWTFSLTRYELIVHVKICDGEISDKDDSTYLEDLTGKYYFYDDSKMRLITLKKIVFTTCMSQMVLCGRGQLSGKITGSGQIVPCSLISLCALKTMNVETIPYECWMDDLAVS